MHVLFLTMSVIVNRYILWFMSLIWSAFVNMWCYDRIANTILSLIYINVPCICFKLWKYTCISFFLFKLWTHTHTYIYANLFWFDLATLGHPWVPINPMGMGLGTKWNPSEVMGFLMGGFCIREHRFGMAKPSSDSYHILLIIQTCGDDALSDLKLSTGPIYSNIVSITSQPYHSSYPLSTYPYPPAAPSPCTPLRSDGWSGRAAGEIHQRATTGKIKQRAVAGTRDLASESSSS
jgi:hypothetical protein